MRHGAVATHVRWVRAIGARWPFINPSVSCRTQPPQKSRRSRLQGSAIGALWVGERCCARPFWRMGASVELVKLCPSQSAAIL